MGTRMTIQEEEKSQISPNSQLSVITDRRIW